MDVKTVRALLARRSDSSWELLATAVGVSESVERTQNGLSAAQIRKAGAGDAISPNIVHARVQALAAFDMSLLEELMATWVSPETLRDRSIYDQESDFWLMAWAAAVRFSPRWQEELRSIKRLPQPLAGELSVLTSDIVSRGLSASLAEVLRSAPDYEDLRSISHRLIADEEVTSAHVDLLHDLAQSDRGPASRTLRLLLKTDLVFAPAAVRRIVELFRDMWISSNTPYGDLHLDLVLTELVCRQSADDPTVRQARDELVTRIEANGPQAWQCTAYLLAGTNWTCP